MGRCIFRLSRVDDSLSILSEPIENLPLFPLNLSKMEGMSRARHFLDRNNLILEESLG